MLKKFRFSFFFFLFTSCLSAFSPTQKEQNAGAVILQKSIHIHITDDAQELVTSKYKIAILSDDAVRDYSQIYTAFNSFYEEKKLDYARVIQPDQTIQEIKQDAIQVQNPQHYNSYDDTKLITFSLPAIQKGSIIEVQVSSKTKKNIIENQIAGGVRGYFWQANQSNNRSRIDPVREVDIVIKIAKNRILYHKEYAMPQPKITENDTDKIYHWHISNLPKVKVENNTLKPYSEILSRVDYSTMENWNIINQKIFYDFDKASQPNKKIRKLAQKLTKGLLSDKKKIEAIYHYIQQNIKYIMANFGKGGITPHNANEIIDNLYGDCKDQTVLMISFLKAIGIQAYPSLVNTYPSELTTDAIVSSNHFNHVITYIPQYNQWIDTTGHNNVYPGVHWSIHKKLSFQLNQHGGHFKKIEIDDLQKIKVYLEIKEEKEKISGYLQIQPKSFISSFYKSFMVNTQDAKTKLQKEFEQFFPLATTTNFEILNVDTPKKEFEIIYNFTIPLKEDLNNNKHYFNTIMPRLLTMIVPIQRLEEPSNRVFGYKYGFKAQIDLTSKIFAFSKDQKIVFDKYPLNKSSKLYSYTFNSYENQMDTSTTITEQLSFKQNEIPRDDYDHFYTQSKSLLQDIVWVFHYIHDDTRSKELMLKNAINSDKNSTKILELIEHYLNSARYEEAKKELDQLLKLEPNHPKANYLNGIVLGYMDEFEKSDEAFAKAKSLGYKE